MELLFGSGIPVVLGEDTVADPASLPPQPINNEEITITNTDNRIFIVQILPEARGVRPQ